ncbi:hypothetical protein CAEBREN_15171 [Caenorhabditis brenneri]|uniref:BTB domain-containing protein n=1 Tax=Caenorhabditis brenneri TaxID=135651 RepID=G0MUW8_CAEBE|nr:hypothetical protein CAEBREN_15171 [Caenorhabditis brenneri]
MEKEKRTHRIPTGMSVPPTPKRIKMEEEKMDFEDPDEQRHDCVLVVKEKKFYCVKATLAKHASFFDKLFFAKNANKKTKEYKLVDPETPEGFQAFLEVIHGVKSLKDENIKEVLSLASLWTAGVAKNRCLEFLSSDQCQMDLKAKFQMACELKHIEAMATQAKKGKFVIEEIRMKFDDPDPRKHDVVLVVDGQKFYCSKATLAKHTHYFNAMFFAGYVENTMREIDLGDPSSADEFQIFLETVHGVKCLTDENVQGVLRLSVTWLADIVRNRCIEFLMGPGTKKTRKETFDMSIELNVPQLMMSDPPTTAAPPPNPKNGFKPLELDDNGRQHRMEFDGTDPNLYDVVLVVQGRKFHVSKAHLASHSDYFKSLFFVEAPEKTEHTLIEPINGTELQVFLEILHGIKRITEYNVDPLLRLARCWRVRVVMDRCEEYMMGEGRDGRSSKDLFALAVEFKLVRLAKKVLSSLTTNFELNSVIPESIADLDQDFKSLIFQKTLEIEEAHKRPPPPLPYHPFRLPRLDD